MTGAGRTSPWALLRIDEPPYDLRIDSIDSGELVDVAVDRGQWAYNA